MQYTKTSHILKDQELLTWTWVGASLPLRKGKIREVVIISDSLWVLQSLKARAQAAQRHTGFCP